MQTQRETESAGRYTLGLDIGVASVGWAIVRLDKDDRPTGIAGMGVRIFDAGVEGDIEAGKESSRAAVRRQKRLMRRQFWRRARRLARLFRLLQRHGLLPPGSSRTPQDRHELLLKLDADLRERHLAAGDRVAFHVLPYRLRTMALERALEPFEIGRVLYHLAQRRGFKSNRKDRQIRPGQEADEKSPSKKKPTTDVATPPTDREPTPSEMKELIATLDKQLRDSGKTLGQFFASLDPEQVRIRGRYTSRQMYADEFERIWSAQAAHHSDLLPDVLKKDVQQAIFFQRPLKSAAHLIGHCSIDARRRRAPIALPIAQQFRMLAALNNLEVCDDHGNIRALSVEERAAILALLSTKAAVKFDEVRRLFKWPKPRISTDKASGRVTVEKPGYTFNLENGGEKSIPGDRTAAEMVSVLGDRWRDFSEARKAELVVDILSFHDPDALRRYGIRVLALDAEAADRLANVRLEDARSAHCRPVLERLAERMADGTTYAQARRELYPEQFAARKPSDFLPPVLKVGAFRDFRNPAVVRVLTELRKVVNELIRRFGKPAFVRVEMARELKKPPKQRQKQAKANRERQSEREAVAAFLKSNDRSPTKANIEKKLLADECNWMCPYTGASIEFDALFPADPNMSPRFDIEHICPRKYLDNSFANKTLCDVTFNRQRKKDRLPAECFNPESQEWHDVIERVSRFNGQLRQEKLRRFRLTEVPDDFVNRQFNDTATANRRAVDYLALLFGGRADEDSAQRVFAVSGGVTGLLRAQWDLNEILHQMPDAPRLANANAIPLNQKRRCDHRHHAIDALVVALTSQGLVTDVMTAAGAAYARQQRDMQLPVPWDGFHGTVSDAVAAIRVSHRPDRRVAGPLHAETIYSKRLPAGAGEQAHRVRRSVASLKPADFSEIPPGEHITRGVADRAVRDAICSAWQTLCDKAGKQLPPDKAFAAPSDHPTLRTGDGRTIPIHRARVIIGNRPVVVGRGHRQRQVDSGTDTLHHTCIVAEKNKKGVVRWIDNPVTRLDMHAILGELRKDVAKGADHLACPCLRPCSAVRNGGTRVFWLCKGDIIEMNVDNNDPLKGTALYVVRGVSGGDVKIRLVHDARIDKDVSATGDRSLFRIRTSDEFRKRRARKVTISPTGEVSRGHEPSA